MLEKKFNAAERVTPEILLERRLIAKIKGRMPKVKILGKGEITKTLIIEGCDISKQAKEKIEKAGGTVK
jgi:large subunit ribosomal protein L15